MGGVPARDRAGTDRSVGRGIGRGIGRVVSPEVASGLANLGCWEGNG